MAGAEELQAVKLQLQEMKEIQAKAKEQARKQEIENMLTQHKAKGIKRAVGGWFLVVIIIILCSWSTTWSSRMTLKML